MSERRGGDDCFCGTQLSRDGRIGTCGVWAGSIHCGKGGASVGFRALLTFGLESTYAGRRFFATDECQQHTRIGDWPGLEMVGSEAPPSRRQQTRGGPSSVALHRRSSGAAIGRQSEAQHQEVKHKNAVTQSQHTHYPNRPTPLRSSACPAERPSHGQQPAHPSGHTCLDPRYYCAAPCSP